MTDLTSSPVFKLADELVERSAALSPIQASFIGIRGHDRAWDDLSPAGHAEREALLRDFRGKLSALGTPSDSWQQLAVRVIGQWLDDRLEWHAGGEHLRDLNHIESSLQALRQVFDVMDTSSAAGFEDVIARLETIDRPFAGYRQTLAEGVRRGTTVARRQVETGIAQARVQAGDASFFRRFAAAYDRAGIGDARLRGRLTAAVDHACAEFGRFADWLEAEVLGSAPARDAVGEERYVPAARRHLGMTIDPRETYAWGWQEIGRLEAEMRRTAEQIRPGATVAEAIDLLSSDPERAAGSHEEFVRFILERQHRALAQLDGTHFDVPEPIRRIEVKIAPPGGPLGAYYMPPSEDFSRAGTVWYSPGDRKSIPLYCEVSTAYHEGFPGHHLQCALQVWHRDRLSRLQRLMVFYPGQGEGWALYAENLMQELGFLERPDYVMGMLVEQLMRACRVVADIGMHLELRVPQTEAWHPGETWSYELGVELMHGRAFLPLDHARSEVTRYLGWPGQAIAYKVGQRVLLELRDEVKKRDGASFDLKRFHSRVLELGSLGLGTLRERVLAQAG